MHRFSSKEPGLDLLSCVLLGVMCCIELLNHMLVTWCELGTKAAPLPSINIRPTCWCSRVLLPGLVHRIRRGEHPTSDPGGYGKGVRQPTFLKKSMNNVPRYACMVLIHFYVLFFPTPSFGAVSCDKRSPRMHGSHVFICVFCPNTFIWCRKLQKALATVSGDALIRVYSVRNIWLYFFYPTIYRTCFIPTWTEYIFNTAVAFISSITTEPIILSHDGLFRHSPRMDECTPSFLRPLSSNLVSPAFPGFPGLIS